MSALAWLLVAAGTLALPGAAGVRVAPTGADPADPPVTAAAAVPAGTAAAPSDPTGIRATARERRLQTVAAVCVAVASTVLAGWRTGVLIGVPAGLGTALVLRQLMRRRPEPAPDQRVALTLDLVAAALRAGRPAADAVAAAAPAADPRTHAELFRVSHLLRLGAAPELAWAGLRATGGALTSVAATATRSAASGLRLAAAFERLAGEIRADTAARATAGAHRAGVVALAPLAACFLPSFVCLGIVPVVVGIAREAFGVLP